MLGAAAVALQRMAGAATLVDLFAARDVGSTGGSRKSCRRQHQDNRGDDEPDHETKATGNGLLPSAWRSTAQCIASSPRIEAASLACARSFRTRPAPKEALTAPCPRHDGSDKARAGRRGMS